MKKFLVGLVIFFTISLATYATTTTVSNRETQNPVAVQRGYRPKQTPEKTKPSYTKPTKKVQKITTPKSTNLVTIPRPTTCPCKQYKAYFETYCSKDKPCIRTGFAQPKRRFSQPNKRFSQPNRRFAQPRVRCNNTAKNSHYYKSGMNKRYKTNNSRYISSQTSRLNKNYSTKQLTKVSCGGITYYGTNNPCK